MGSNEDVDSELDELRHQREQGYPEKQKGIRERHALEVLISPLTVTQVEYERGEIEVGLEDGKVARSLTLGYGNGVGITEELECEFCNQTLGEQNPLRSIKEGLRCEDCDLI